MSDLAHLKSVADRLHYIIAEKGFKSIRSAARDIGIPPRTLNGVISRNAIGKTTARLIERTWGVNSNWLMHGEGSIYSDLGVSSDSGDRHTSETIFAISLVKRIRRLQTIFEIDTDEHLARLVGIPLEELTHALEVDMIEDETANAIGEALGVEPLWIKEGIGPISRGGREISREPLHDSSGIVHSGKTIISVQNADFVVVPKAPTKPQVARDSALLELGADTANYVFNRKWITSRVSEVENALLVEVEGNSMLPAFCNGDVVMIDLGQSDLVAEDYYCIAMDDVFQIKQLTPLPNSQVRVTSANPGFFDYTAKITELQIIGRVVWHERTLV